jgi:hypothetical protein
MKGPIKLKKSVDYFNLDPKQAAAFTVICSSLMLAFLNDPIAYPCILFKGLGPLVSWKHTFDVGWTTILCILLMQGGSSPKKQMRAHAPFPPVFLQSSPYAFRTSRNILLQFLVGIQLMKPGPPILSLKVSD